MYGIKIIIIMIPVVLKCPHCGAIVVGQVRPNSGGGNYAVCSSCGRSVSFTYSANSTTARIDHVGWNVKGMYTLSKETEANLSAIITLVQSRWTLGDTHGISHWKRVWENGKNFLTPMWILLSFNFLRISTILVGKMILKICIMVWEQLNGFPLFEICIFNVWQLNKLRSWKPHVVCILWFLWSHQGG